MLLCCLCCPCCLCLHAAAIRQYLCLSLLKNSASSIPAALQLSASIFLSLLQKFRSALKAEVGVFFPMIMLKVGSHRHNTHMHTMRNPATRASGPCQQQQQSWQLHCMLGFNKAYFSRGLSATNSCLHPASSMFRSGRRAFGAVMLLG